MSNFKWSVIKSIFIFVIGAAYQATWMFVLGKSKSDDDPINQIKMVCFGINLLLMAMALTQLRKPSDE